jgi:hypothetical protein
MLNFKSEFADFCTVRCIENVRRNWYRDMSRHLRKGRLVRALFAPDLGKTDRAKSGAFALNRCGLPRARAGPSRGERICAKHAHRRKRRSPSSRSQCRQYGCPTGRRFRPTRSPSVTVAAHLAGADRCGPGRQRRAQMTRSTDVAHPLDGVVATGVAELVPIALNADPRSRTSRPPGSREWRVLTTPQETRQAPRQTATSRSCRSALPGSE